MGKKRIETLHHEMHALLKRVKHFSELLSLNSREQENMCISSRVVVSMRDSLQKKYDTYKGAIKEITDSYGFRNTSFKVRPQKEAVNKIEARRISLLTPGIPTALAAYSYTMDSLKTEFPVG